MTLDDVTDGCASAGRNEDFGSAHGNSVRNRFAARSVPSLCVQSDSVSTDSSGMMGHRFC